jgi:hypothetical protein
MSNIGFDSVNTGFQFLETSGATNGQITNAYVQAPSGASGGFGINISGVNSLILDIANFRSSLAPNNCIGMSGSADVAVTNMWCDSWNQLNSGNPAFNVTTGTILTLGGRLRTNGGNGGAISAGSGSYNASHVN